MGNPLLVGTQRGPRTSGDVALRAVFVFVPRTAHRWVRLVSMPHNVVPTTKASAHAYLVRPHGIADDFRPLPQGKECEIQGDMGGVNHGSLSQVRAS